MPDFERGVEDSKRFALQILTASVAGDEVNLSMAAKDLWKKLTLGTC